MNLSQSKASIMAGLQQLDEIEFRCLMNSLIWPGRQRAPDDLSIDKPRICYAFADLRGFIVVANKQYCWGGRCYNLVNGKSRSVRYLRSLDQERLEYLVKSSLVDLYEQTERQERQQPDESRFYELCLARRQAGQQQKQFPSVQLVPQLISLIDGQLQELEAIHGASWVADLLEHFELKDCTGGPGYKNV